MLGIVVVPGNIVVPEEGKQSVLTLLDPLLVVDHDFGRTILGSDLFDEFSRTWGVLREVYLG